MEETDLDYTSQNAGVMHACGHDVHMTSFIGTARALSKLRDQWKGTVVMIGQPAEERVLGARLMLRAGLFSKFPKPDKAIALHCASDLPHGTVGIVEGYALANVDSVEIVVKGVGEIGLVPTSGAVAAAYHQIDGEWRTTLPMGLPPTRTPTATPAEPVDA